MLRGRFTTAGVVALLFLAFGGYIKGAPPLSWSPVDPTLLAALVVAVAVVVELWRAIPAIRKQGWLGLPRGLLPLVLLWATFGLGVRVDASDYGRSKVVDLATLVALSAAGGLLLLRGNRTRRMWVVGVAVLAGVVAALAVLFPDPLADRLGRLAVEGSNTIASGRALGAASVALLGMALFWHGRRRVLAIAGGLASLALLVGTASRGPAVAALVALAVVAALGRGRSLLSRAVLLKVGLPALVLGVVVVGLAVRLRVVSNHLLALRDKSANARVVLYEQALHAVAHHPLGIGWGGFDGKLYVGNLIPGEPWVLYPHNIVLEIAGEAGWVAGAVFVAVLGLALRRTLRTGLPPTVLVMGGLLVFFTLNALVSGDVNDNRGLWVMIGAALAVRSVEDAQRPVAGAARVRRADLDTLERGGAVVHRQQ